MLAIESVPDQDGIVLLDDRPRDRPASVPRVSQAPGRTVEVPARHHHEDGAPVGLSRQLPERAQDPDGDAVAGGRRAGRSCDGRPRQVELLEHAQLDQARLDGMKLGEQEQVRALAEPSLGLPDQVGDALGASGRPLRPGRRPAQDEQPLRLAARLDARDRDLGGRVPDVDAGDEHRCRLYSENSFQNEDTPPWASF